MRATSTVKLSPLSYFANTTDEMRNVMPVSPILLTKCYVVPTTCCFALLTVMTESSEKQTSLIITFKTNPVLEKVYKSEPLGSICCKSLIDSYIIF